MKEVLRKRVKDRYNQIRSGGVPPEHYRPEDVGPAIHAVIDVVGDALQDVVDAVNKLGPVSESEYWRTRFRNAELERLNLERECADLRRRLQLYRDVNKREGATPYVQPLADVPTQPATDIAEGGDPYDDPLPMPPAGRPPTGAELREQISVKEVSPPSATAFPRLERKIPPPWEKKKASEPSPRRG